MSLGTLMVVLALVVLAMAACIGELENRVERLGKRAGSAAG